MGASGRAAFAARLAGRDPGGTLPSTRLEYAAVTAVTAGGSSDGTALCTVTWRDLEFPVARLAAYTPVVGHAVVLAITGEHVVCLGRVEGIPS